MIVLLLYTNILNIHLWIHYKDCWIVK